ncbi:MAG: DNA starvation/stationary phase protection protein Dps [Steroidobacteraceae bacterium]
MHKTRNDLALDIRRPVVDLLNARLADLIDLNLQAKQAHWNVKGPNFIALHELFDKLAEEVEESVDEVAERAIALGGTAKGTVAAVSKTTQLSAYPLDIVQGVDHLNALSNALATTGKSIRAAIEESGKLGDADTSDLFTGISRSLDKLLWMLEAHLQADK